MADCERLPQDWRELREMVRQAREARGLLPQQVAAAIGVTTDDVAFVEAHGVAPTPAMLEVLSFFRIADYESGELARLAALIPGDPGPAIVTQLVEGGFKTVEAIEAAAEEDLLGLPWFDLGQLSLLRQGLRLYRSAETTGDVDES